MEAKKYLQQVKKLDKLIQNKQIEIEQWKTIASGVTGTTEGERVQSSGNQQKMENAICKYISIQKELEADIDRYVAVKKEIIGTIEQLPDVEYDILHKVYIQDMEFAMVAAVLDKSYSWVTTIHGKALSHVGRILEERGMQK